MKVMKQGWIKIYRQLFDKGFYRNSAYVHLWLHLLLRANHRDKEFLYNGKLRTCKRGQLITGIPTLSLETGIHRSTVERALKLFENENQIERQRTNKFSIITITNYEQYQGNENQAEKPARSWREQTRSKEVKKKKKTAKTDAFAGRAGEVYCSKKGKKLSGSVLKGFYLFWDAFSFKRGKAEAADAWIDLKPSDEMIAEIVAGAKREAITRLERIKAGQTPKMAQGWLSGRRWEDEDCTQNTKQGEWI